MNRFYNSQITNHIGIAILIGLLLPSCVSTNKPTNLSLPQVHAITDSGIAIYQIGSGEPIIIIPGGPGASSKLYRRYLASLAEKYKVIFWDYRNTGNSKNISDFSFENDHKDFKSVITKLGLDQFSIIAHSYGGVHAIKYAYENQERVKKLILISTSPWFWASSKKGRDLKKQNLSSNNLKRMGEIFQVLESSGHIPALENELSSIEANNQLLNPTEEQRNEFAIDSELNYESVMKTEGWVNLDQRELLPKIKAKTLVIYSEKDIVVAPEFSQELAHKIPSSKTYVFKNSRHWCFWEENEAFVKVAKTFLQQ